ncbi:MAG: ADP-ribosylation factor-like protein [Promethearchaeota archaeon]
MLRQVFVLKRNEIIYQRVYANALNTSEVDDISFRIISEAKKSLGRTTSYFDYIKYRIAYDVDLELNLAFLFITGLVDDFYRSIKIQLITFKEVFLDRFRDKLKEKDTNELNFKGINVMLDELHRNLKPKISLVGFAGVGKTTIRKLIKMDEIPLQHVPTITGDIATIKIGNLFFRLFDFAGQEQFKFLWKTFIKESYAVLIVIDSTIENVKKSNFFFNLKTKEVPHARAAIIGNKQDLLNAMSVKEIETLTGLKTYPMVANRKENRNKMIRIMADILDISPETSPLLKDLFETTDLTYETLFGIEEKALINININVKEVLLNEVKIEKDKKEKNIRQRINQIASKNYDQKIVKYTKEKINKEDINNPIKNALITSELYYDLLNSNSYSQNKLLSILFTIINCVFFTITNPEKFPKFSAFLRYFKMDVFDSKEINTIRKYYSQILEKKKFR